MREELFLKNTQALFEVDENLAYNLRSLKNIAFKLIQNENGINFTKDEILLYQNPNQELLENLSLFQNEYAKYPVLFFYGFGNGMLYKSLCENENHQHIIVFEDDLEILALAFHLFDFSEALKNEKLILFHTQTLNTAQLSTLFSYEIIQKSVKIFNLFIHSDFYQNFQNTQIQNTNAQLIEMIRFIVLNKGNDPHDSLVGIKHTLDNLPKMLNHGIFQEFLKERRAKVKNAIIVSTGPSLIKQLPLLKKYASKATLFCADSAYPILAKQGIKPDYVCMLERTEITAECFNNDFKDFDKDIIFLIASLVHKKTITYLEKNKRNYMLILKGQPFAKYLGLDDYGYINAGMSVSHMAYEFAENLGHKNIVLIGQDLAYAKDGQTHSKGFIHANLHNGDYERDFRKFTTTAYGGEGKVESSEIWTLFRQIFENFIAFSQSKTYNCTQGGARIESAIEKPFKEVCKDFLENEKDKKFKKLQVLNTKEQVELGLKIYKKIKKNMSLALHFQKECKKIKKQIHNLTHGKNKLSLDEINQNIDKIKEKLSSQKYSFSREILGPTLHHEQSLLVPLYLKDIKNEADKQNKLFAWVYAHEALIENIIELLEAQDKRLKISILPLQDFLEKKKAL